jgi:hypothetical protein
VAHRPSEDAVVGHPVEGPGVGFLCVWLACTARKSFEIRAEWDSEAGVWWCSNDELRLTTEAPTFEQLVFRVLEIAPWIAVENGFAAPGDQIQLRAIAERMYSVPVVAAA